MIIFNTLCIQGKSISRSKVAGGEPCYKIEISDSMNQFYSPYFLLAEHAI